MSHSLKKHALTLIIGALLGIALYLYSPQLMRTGSGEPPQNFIAVTETLATSGQPSPEQLQQLAVDGYRLVINLAPPDVYGSIADEGYLIAANGISYVNIPVDWHNPLPVDFQLFSDILAANAGRRTLVHCQTNKRASLFTFLYRVIHDRVPPDTAIEKVHAVWVPEAHWQTFMESILAAHGIEYEFF